MKGTTTGARSVFVFLSLILLQPHPPSARTLQEVTDPELGPERLLVRSYLLAQDFVPEERALHFERLAEVAAVLQPALARLWAEELFQLTFTLPRTHDRVASQKNALTYLSQVDPERAMELFGTMDNLVPMREGWVAEDVRAFGARTVFAQYWKHKKGSGLENIRTEALHLAETGLYPFAAMAPILRDLSESDPAAAQAVFSEALASFQRPTFLRVETRESMFSRFLRDVWEVIPAPLAHEALRSLVSDLVSRKEDELENYRVQVYTDKGAVSFGTMSDRLLFELAPLIREVDPVWIRRLSADRPEFARAMQVGGSLQRSEGTVVRGRATSAEIMAAAQRGSERRRLAHIQSIAPENPEEALRLTTTLPDPVLRATGLAYAAVGFTSRSPERARDLTEGSKQTIGTLEDEPGKVEALASLAQAYASLGDLTSFRATARQAFDLGTELFQQDLDAHPGKLAIFAVTFKDLTKLTRVAVRFDTAHTLAHLTGLQNNVLQAHLLVDAASALEDIREDRDGTGY